MNARRTNLMLWSTSAALLMAAVAVAGFAWFAPVEVDDVAAAVPGQRSKDAVATMATTTAGGLPPLAAFEPVWRANLRRSLGEAAVAAPQTQAAQTAGAAAAAPPLTLVGTIGDSLAMLRTAGGTVEVRGVGETIGAAKILQIRPSQVELEIGGQKFTLQTPREEPGLR